MMERNLTLTAHDKKDEIGTIRLESKSNHGNGRKQDSLMEFSDSDSENDKSDGEDTNKAILL